MTSSSDDQLREELIPACEGEPDDELAMHESTVLLRQRAPPRFNVYIFVISLATLIPLSTLGSLVDVITAQFNSKEYELVIGLLFLSAFPRSMRLPDPFTPNLKVDLLPEISQPPRILSSYSTTLPPGPAADGSSRPLSSCWKRIWIAPLLKAQGITAVNT